MTDHDISILEESLRKAKNTLSDQMKIKKSLRNERTIADAKIRINTITNWLYGTEVVIEKPLTQAQQLKNVRSNEDLVLRELRRQEFEEMCKALDTGEEGKAKTMVIKTTREVDYVFDLIRRELFDRDPPRTNLNFLWSRGAVAYYSDRVHHEISREKISKAHAQAMVEKMKKTESTTNANKDGNQDKNG